MAHLEDIAGDARPRQHRHAPDPRAMQILARGPPVQGARLPLLPHRFVVDAERHDEAADVNLNVAGASDFVSALYDASAVPALPRRLGLQRS